MSKTHKSIAKQYATIAKILKGYPTGPVSEAVAAQIKEVGRLVCEA